MLRGRKIGLRARQQADVAVLHTELYEDVATRSRADSNPWRPIPAESAASPFAPADTGDAACFSVVELASGELAGDALLWGIDLHNRPPMSGCPCGPPSAAAARHRRRLRAVQLRLHHPRPAPAAGRHAGR